MIDKIVDNVMLTKIGNRVLFIIRRRTKKGKFLPGSSPGAGKYSTKNFVMPAGAINKTTHGKIKKASQDKNSNFELFTANTGNLWILVKGGYAKLRELAGKPNDKVSMSWTGSYMRDLGILRSNKRDVILGWKSKENERLATYHEILGAGKSKKLHKILGLTKQEEKELIPEVEKAYLKSVAYYFKNKINGSTNF